MSIKYGVYVECKQLVYNRLLGIYNNYKIATSKIEQFKQNYDEQFLFYVQEIEIQGDIL